MRDFDPQRDAGLVERVAQLAPTPPGSHVRELLGRYLEQVATWNRKLDLTAAKGPEAQVEVMLADAMVLSDPQLCPASARVLDVGTGAGAPIVPLLILRDDLSAVCLEPLHKRAAFLRTASARLGLVHRMK
ncbi:MAG: class I SAM-dependent methyltransferase, partial [Myxococcales bacterium]|nr:class I SAM-dependent methyltransferase [Myxococcales bacterium]